MFKSMTAFGRASLTSPLGRFSVEMQSLNRKFLEVIVVLPPEMSYFETQVRKWVASKLNRGKVTVRISANFENDTPLTVTPNISLARQVKTAWEKIASELELELENTFVLQMLGSEPGVLSRNEEFKDEDKYRAVLSQVVYQALEALIAMKLAEGENILQDFVPRLSKLEAWIAKIEEHAHGLVKRYRGKIKGRIEEVLPGAVENEERILREICLFAEKADISEEITRFRSHLDQFSQLISSEPEDKGKKLDFLLQELHREINTIGSKSADIEVSKLAVEVKSELEKIREQVQNIE